MKHTALLLSLFSCIGCGPMMGDNAPPATTPTTSAPDNTGVNSRDRAPAAKTPIDQNENQRDIQITADIRKAIIATTGMSTNAQNVKIITADGKVVLRGPVDSADEKKAVENHAIKVAGKDNVTSELEIAK